MSRALITFLLFATGACAADDGPTVASPPTEATACPADAAYALDIGGTELERWETADGCAVATAVIAHRRGSAECQWETARFLTIGSPLGETFSAGEGRTYIFDPVNLLSYVDGEVRNRIVLREDLPGTVVDTGFRQDAAELWLDPDEPRYLYVASEIRADRYELDTGEPLTCDG